MDEFKNNANNRIISKKIPVGRVGAEVFVCWVVAPNEDTNVGLGVPNDIVLDVPNDGAGAGAAAGAGAVAEVVVWPNENDLLVAAVAPNCEEVPCDAVAPMNRYLTWTHNRIFLWITNITTFVLPNVEKDDPDPKAGAAIAVGAADTAGVAKGNVLDVTGTTIELEKCRKYVSWL